MFNNVLYKLLLLPRSQSDEDRRREYLVNVLLCGLAIVTFLKMGYLATHPSLNGFDQEEDSLAVAGLFLLFVIGLWQLSRRGYFRISAACLICLLSAEAVRLTVQWSFELPVTQLLYALTIVIAGILLTKRCALLICSLLLFCLLVVSYYQISDHLQPHTDWLQHDFQMSDAIGYAAILGIIVLVSWLTNREMSQSLSRIQASERALCRERDSLEIKVAERTDQLKQLQMRRLSELQHYAEFGRLSTGLLHEITNPLTAASLNLQQVDDNESALISQTKASLHQLERYIEAARRQAKCCSDTNYFDLLEELEQVACVMRPLAQRAKIKLQLQPTDHFELSGDPIKFDQVVANLIANAIDACDQSTNKPSRPTIQVTTNKNHEFLNLHVKDNGRGITESEMPHLFEPFYSTKTACDRNLGIGLTMIKQIVEDDFGGLINVFSTPGKGTEFCVSFRLNNKPKAV